MSTDSVISVCKNHMNKAIEHLEAELLKIRTGKASPSMLDSVMVSYYGTPTPIQQVAAVNTPDARTLSVQPWEKNMIPEIEKAIIQSNLGLNPQNDGELIRINVPALTEERRREMVKLAKDKGEHAKVGLRTVRREANESIKKLQKEGLAEDLAKDTESQIQKITDDFSKKVEELVAIKEKDIMKV